MQSFAEISASLDKALTEVTEKKKVLDAASNAVTDASNKYQEAVSKAQSLKKQLNDALAEILPMPSDRVKISA